VPRVFLSHAAVDKPLIDDLKTMLQRAIGVQPSEFFYSSGRGTGVPAGENFVEYIRSMMVDSTFVVAVITPAFRNSEFCLAELGAVWLAADKDFYPVCVPAVDRGELKATLTGIQVERIDERATLADLLQRVALYFGREYNAPACDEEISVFMGTLSTRLATLAAPTMVPASELEVAQATIDSLGEHLSKARDEVEAERQRGDEIKRAKTLAEIEEIERSIPSDIREQIVSLLATAGAAVYAVPTAVSDALPFELRGEGMPWPDYGSSEHDGIARQVDDGRLRDNGDNTVSVNREWPDVRKAAEAVEELQAALNHLDIDAEAWFLDKYGVPADLRQGAAFRKLL